MKLVRALVQNNNCIFEGNMIEYKNDTDRVVGVLLKIKQMPFMYKLSIDCAVYDTPTVVNKYIVYGKYGYDGCIKNTLDTTISFWMGIEMKYYLKKKDKLTEIKIGDTVEIKLINNQRVKGTVVGVNNKFLIIDAENNKTIISNIIKISIIKSYKIIKEV